jgi:hypothetical protein
MINMIKYIKYEEGIKGFFRGSSLSLAKNIIGFSTFFTNLSTIGQYLNTQNLLTSY